MFLNIITPCSRPGNLFLMAKSINIPRENYRWLVIIDSMKPAIDPGYPENAEVYYYQDQFSYWGNAQRNLALDKIHDGYVYFLDDDTTIHPDLWKTVENLTCDFIHFDQSWPDGRKRVGGIVKLNKVDSGNVLIDYRLIGRRRWVLDKRYADGLFIEQAFAQAHSPIYIKKVLSVYNSLRSKT
jgi:hypothetical protein